MGVKTLTLNDDVTLPWQNDLFLGKLQEKICRQVVILAPELNTFVYLLSQTVLQLGYLTFIACDELQEADLHKILRLTQTGVTLMKPDDLTAELSLTETATAKEE